MYWSDRNSPALLGSRLLQYFFILAERDKAKRMSRAEKTVESKEGREYTENRVHNEAKGKVYAGQKR